jgi:hypothetical protein
LSLAALDQGIEPLEWMLLTTMAVENYCWLAGWHSGLPHQLEEFKG